MKKIIQLTALALVIIGSPEVTAQQQVMFTQYMFNGLAINPAYAGSQETLSATALFREQWSGLDGAPKTQTFSVHSLKSITNKSGTLKIGDAYLLTQLLDCTKG